MIYEFKGLIKTLSAVETGQGKNGIWYKQEIVVAGSEIYSDERICFTCWGETISQLKKLEINDHVIVEFTINTRPYLEKWFSHPVALHVNKFYNREDAQNENLSNMLEQLIFTGFQIKETDIPCDYNHYSSQIIEIVIGIADEIGLPVKNKNKLLNRIEDLKKLSTGWI